MSDQATQLRELMLSMGIQSKALPSDVEKPDLKIIAVASGKGGVGKSNYAVNLAIALAQQNHKPILLDADFGFANVEILLGQKPKHILSEMLKDHTLELKDLLTPTDYQVSFISGGSAVKDMMFLNENQIDQISRKLKDIENEGDILIIDIGAGMSDIAIKFSLLADEIHVVVIPEPTSKVDAYAFIKTLFLEFKKDLRIKLIVNKARYEKEALDVYETISSVCDLQLDKKLYYGGYIPRDRNIEESAYKQIPVMMYAPKSISSQAFTRISKSLVDEFFVQEQENKPKESLFNKFKNILAFKK